MALSILMGMIFVPALERAIDASVYLPAKISVECTDGGCKWDMRTMSD